MGTSNSSGIGRGRKGLPKPTRAQIIRRQDKVVELSQKGATGCVLGCSYWIDQIAAALRVSETTIAQDRADRRAEVPDARGRPVHRHQDPEPYDWMAEPKFAAQATYWFTGPVPRLQSLRDWLKENNARNQFSFNVADARRVNDAAFDLEIGELLAELAAYIANLQEIHGSDAARKEALHHSARDDLKEESRRNVTNSEKSLPAMGKGRPTGYHAALWQEWWDGKDVMSPQVIDLVAKQLRHGTDERPGRIRRAAAELLEALGPPPS